VPDIAAIRISDLAQEGVPAFTVNQPVEGLDVLRQRAKDLKVRRFLFYFRRCY
jgi:hypothetical protein